MPIKRHDIKKKKNHLEREQVCKAHLLSECRIEVTFGASIPVWQPKMSPKNRAVLYPVFFFFFIKQIISSFLLCETYQKLAILNPCNESSIVCPMKNMEISWKNMQQLPKSQCTFLSNMQQMTIHNNLDPVYRWFKTIDFNSK